MSRLDDLYDDISDNYNKLKDDIPQNKPSFSEFEKISSKEQQVIDNINEMSKIISCYKIKKYNADAEEKGYDKIDPIDDYCVAKYRSYTFDELDASFANIFNNDMSNNTTQLKGLLLNYPNTRPGGNLDSSLNVVDDKSIEDVLKNYNDLQSNRNKLKTTLSELKSEKGTFSRESELHLDATIYSSILWTTVATGLLYYVFTAL